MIPERDLSVSVIIVARHAQDTIGSTLKSLAIQSLQPNETILVVDLLDDPTVEAAQQYRVKVVKSTEGGIGAARREGINAATGDIIAFTDSDCSAEEHWIETLTSTFLERDDVAVISGRNVTFKNYAPQDKNTKAKKDIWYDFAPTMNFAFRRNLIQEVGNFDPYFSEGGEDMDFCIRLKESGYRIFYNPKAIIFHHESGKMTKKAVRNGKTRAKNFKKHRRSALGAATIAFAHSLCLVGSIILLILGFYFAALVVIIPSIVHRLYGATINLKDGKGVRYTVRGFFFAYISNLSFFLYWIALLTKPVPSPGSG
jgi:GT2 family glycosyltransferase